jgi:hypothetical protein
MRNHLPIIALVSLISFHPAHADGISDLMGLLASAKMAGVCGIMDSQVDFQTKTKMHGGDEIIGRFWLIEATRLGLSTEEFYKLCEKSVLIYDKYRNELEEMQKEESSK